MEAKIFNGADLINWAGDLEGWFLRGYFQIILVFKPDPISSCFEAHLLTGKKCP